MHRIALSPNPSSVRQARAFAADLVADADVRDLVVLLVSELVSNAVDHGGPHGPGATVGLAIAKVGDRVRIEVEDAGANIPVVDDGALDRLRGRGLLLVQGLATRWGYEHSGLGKVVWAEVALPPVTASKGGERHG